MAGPGFSRHSLVAPSSASSLESAPASTARAPLVVDLDGTLTPADTLIEAILKLIKSRPLLALLLPLWWLRGRARFKVAVSQHAAVSAESLPYRPDLVAWLKAEKASGRRIVLATASCQRTAEAVAAHLGFFDGALGSDERRNLKGVAKLEAIRTEVGEEFIYAGDSSADIPIWRFARAAVLVGASPSVARAIQGLVAVERVFPKDKAGLSTWARALRVHQWLKNLLLLVPLLTAFSFSQPKLIFSLLAAFLSFCLAASATYLVNDLWDLESDRAHPRKHKRPFASAQISVITGLMLVAVMLVTAFAIAAAVSGPFLAVLATYLVITSLYSWLLKQVVLVDVITLAALYTIRIIAGAVVIGEPVSSWLLAFSVFIFFSLALVKRCSELVSLRTLGQHATRGRDYRVGDLAVLWPIGAGASLCAVVVFGLFVMTNETRMRYVTPELLWLVGIGLLYWLSRIWIKAARGEMHDDPLVFAARDLNSRATIACMVATTVLARFVPIQDLIINL